MEFVALSALFLGLAVFIAVPPAMQLFADYRRDLAARLQQLGEKVSPELFMVQQLMLGLAGGVLGYVVGGGAGFLVVAVVGVFLPSATLKAAAYRRIRLIDSQFIDTMTIITTCIRAGQNLTLATDAVARRAASPTKEEFLQLRTEVQAGVPVEQALHRLALRLRLPSYEAFSSAVGVVRSAGGDLGQICDRVTEAARESSRLEGLVEAMTAQGKMQTRILALVPFVVGGGLYMYEPSMITALFRPILGYVVLAFIVAFWGTGILLMQRITSVKV